MKKLISEVKEHIKMDFNLAGYIYIFVFVSFSIFINFYFDFEHKFIGIYFGKITGLYAYFLFYCFAYYGSVIPFLLLKNQSYKLKQSEFWVKSFVFIGIIGLMSGLYQYRTYAMQYIDKPQEMYYLIKIFSNLKRIIPYIIVLSAVKYFYDRQLGSLYGLRLQGLNLKPFFAIILILLPLVILASFQSDFLKTYPQFKFWRFETAPFGLNQASLTFLYQLCYGLDFISVELMFRGALVIGMIKVLGREAIMPMAVIYVFIHFGKPAGEAVSSFFGGYILGIFAFYHKNILGGIIIHLGIAYMMEFTAIIQHLYN